MRNAIDNSSGCCAENAWSRSRVGFLRSSPAYEGDEASEASPSWNNDRVAAPRPRARDSIPPIEEFDWLAVGAHDDAEAGDVRARMPTALL